MLKAQDRRGLFQRTLWHYAQNPHKQFLLFTSAPDVRVLRENGALTAGLAALPTDINIRKV